MRDGDDRPSAEGTNPDPKGFQLHARLVAGDRAAIDELWLYFFDLVAVGKRKVMTPGPHVEDIANEYASRAIVRLIKTPTRFDPTRNKSLFNYLRMDVEGDVLNHVQSVRYRTPVDSIDESLAATDDDVGDRTRGGNLASDDPLPDEIVVAREGDETVTSIRQRVVKTREDGIVFDLQYIHAEKSTVVFAEALGLAHLPVREQEGEIQRTKDRLAKRLRRMREDFL